jgi:hypothetical protein
MAATPIKPSPRREVFGGLDRSVERVLGADMRLIYGMTAPILMVIGLIIVLALLPATWLVITILVFELAMLAIVVGGLMTMLGENEEDDTPVP